MEFYSSSNKLWNTAMFPTSPYNVSLVSPTSSGWAPSSFTTPQQQQSIGSSASWTHEFKGVPLRCGWYHSGRTAVPSLKSHVFYAGGKHWIRTIQTKSWPKTQNTVTLITCFFKFIWGCRVYYQVIFSLHNLYNFAVKVRQLMGSYIICDIHILKGSSQKASHPWSQHHVPCTRCRVNPSFTHKKTQLDHSSQNKNVKPFQVW